MKKIKAKNINFLKTILINIHLPIWGIILISFGIMSFRALDKITFSEPILKIPFIIIIVYALIEVVEKYNPYTRIVLKNNDVIFR